MPRKRTEPIDVRKQRPATPYLPDGTLDPREWGIAKSAASIIGLMLTNRPWFVKARPVEVQGKGVELEVVVRWRSSEVLDKVPVSVDGYDVNVVLAGEQERPESGELH